MAKVKSKPSASKNKAKMRAKSGKPLPGRASQTHKTPATKTTPTGRSNKRPGKTTKVAQTKKTAKSAKSKKRVKPVPARVTTKSTAKPKFPTAAKTKHGKTTKRVEPLPVTGGQAEHGSVNGDQPPVATNLKPLKNRAGISSRELQHFRDLLLEKRHEIVGDMSSMEREALRSGGSSNLSTLPMHMADMGTDNYEQEFTLGLVEKDRNLLRDLNLALAKIQNGTFGLCEGTGKPISKARLEVQPWARFSIEYARKLELGGMGVR